MASNKPSLTGYVAHVYDAQDNLLATTKIVGHEPNWQEIELKACLDVKKGDVCKILVLTDPFPHEYMGTVRYQTEASVVFALYRKKQKEDRKNVRYKTNAVAVIEKIIFVNPMDTAEFPLDVKLLNLSQSGMRIAAAENVLAPGDKFALCLKTKENEERFFLEVVNTSSHGPDMSEYGCHFIPPEQMTEESTHA